MMSCDTMRRYPSEANAKRTLAKIRKKHRKHVCRREEQRVYRCPICNQWHLTSRGFDG
jgi:hypothetical protein